MAGRRGVAAMEFAIITIPFLAFVFFVIEVGYDLFTQEALDAGLNQAVKQLSRGNAQNVRDATSFVSSYLCPDLRGLLQCDTHIYIKIQKFPATGATDYFDITTGKVPISGNALDLSSYQATGSFCNVAPDQFVLISVLYVGPTFLGYLFPNIFSANLNGVQVHATQSTSGLATERFSPIGVKQGVTVATSC